MAGNRRARNLQESNPIHWLGSDQRASGTGGNLLCDTPVLRAQADLRSSQANSIQTSERPYQGGMELHPLSTLLPQRHSATFTRNPKDIPEPSILS